MTEVSSTLGSGLLHHVPVERAPDFDENAGISNGPVEMSAADEQTDPSTSDVTKAIDNHLSVIEFPDNRGSIGINIVGGLDQPHLPDEPGIFVSYVAPDGMAARDGRIKIGDQIVSINGRPLEAVNHEEAVAAFRSRVVDGGATVLVVERDAEARILAQPILARPSPPPQPQYYAPANNVGETKKSSVSQESSGSSAKKDEPLKIGNNSATTVAPSPSASEDQPTAAKSGWKSAASNNHADEVPRTPRRPLSVFDPRNPSWTSELIFVSIGVATIALAGFAIYRWSRR